MASSSHESNVVWDLRERAARAFELSRQVLLSNQWRLVSQSPRGDVHTMVEPNVGRLYMVTVLDEGIDVTYAVTQARLGGLVAPRDWLTLRVWRDYTNPQGFPETISTGVNVQLPEYPPGRKCVRGETLLGAFTITDLGQEGGAPRSLFRFITAVRLGGWLPRSITELYVTDGIVQFADDVRRRVKDAKDP